MNKTDRKQLEKALGMIEDAKEIINLIQEHEQEKFENLNEGLQNSERGQILNDNADILENINTDIESVTEQLSDLING